MSDVCTFVSMNKGNKDWDDDSPLPATELCNSSVENGMSGRDEIVVKSDDEEIGKSQAWRNEAIPGKATHNYNRRSEIAPPTPADKLNCAWREGQYDKRPWWLTDRRQRK